MLYGKESSINLNKQLLPLLIFLILTLILWRGLALKPHLINSALVGRSIPAFSLPNLEDNSHTLNESIFKGKITILNVWASWCATCANEHDFLTRVHKTGDFQLVGLSYKDQKNSADLWLNKRGNPYRVNIFDEQGRLSLDLGVYATPTLYVIDPMGIVRYRHVGVLTDEIWDSVILPEIKSIKGY